MTDPNDSTGLARKVHLAELAAVREHLAEQEQAATDRAEALLAPIAAKAREHQARDRAEHRAQVLREAADVAEHLMDERYGPDCSYGVGGLDVARELRRLADEAQQQPEAEDDEALRAKVDDATATLRRIRSTIKSWEQQALPHSQAHRLLTEVRDALAGPNPDPDPEPEPTPEDTVRAHVTTLHLIGEQLADVESWLWDHLGDVREAARRERGGPLPDDVAPAAPESEPSVHGESVAHLAGLHDDEPAVDARQDGACPPGCIACATDESLASLRQRHAADQELSAITTEAEQLEKRLAELRAREAELAPAKPKRKRGAYARDYDTREVRAWADANGIDCPRVGQIPKRVLDAWRAREPK